jgi:hypothetical protein
MPVANVASTATSGTSSSHDQCGRPPAASRKISTVSRFSPRLKSAVRTVASGTARSRELDLRTRFSRSTSERTEPLVASAKKPYEDDAEQQRDRVVAHAAAEVEDLREDAVEDAEEHQRPHELPQVAEHRAEEAQPEVGHARASRSAGGSGGSRCRARTGP